MVQSLGSLPTWTSWGAYGKHLRREPAVQGLLFHSPISAFQIHFSFLNLLFIFHQKVRCSERKSLRPMTHSSPAAGGSKHGVQQNKTKKASLVRTFLKKWILTAQVAAFNVEVVHIMNHSKIWWRAQCGTLVAKVLTLHALGSHIDSSYCYYFFLLERRIHREERQRGRSSVR